MATRPMPSSFAPPCSLRNVFAVRPQPVIPPRSASVHVIPWGRRKRDHFPKPFRNNLHFVPLASAYNASCATLSRIVAPLRRARTKGDPHEEHSAAADQRYVRLRQGRAFRHAAGAVAHGLPYPQPADGACLRHAQLSQVLHPRHHRVRAPEPRHLGGARL